MHRSWPHVQQRQGGGRLRARAIGTAAGPRPCPARQSLSLCERLMPYEGPARGSNKQTRRHGRWQQDSDKQRHAHRQEEEQRQAGFGAETRKRLSAAVNSGLPSLATREPAGRVTPAGPSRARLPVLASARAASEQPRLACHTGTRIRRTQSRHGAPRRIRPCRLSACAAPAPGGPSRGTGRRRGGTATARGAPPRGRSPCAPTTGASLSHARILDARCIHSCVRACVRVGAR